MLHHFFLLAAASVSGIEPSSLPQADANSHSLKIILNFVLGIIGALALLMITVSGLRYITSAGDPQKASQAKAGIITALIGIAIALAAGAIVNFVADFL
jgi:hypothetical protein